uniref:uncharacterized protein LOC122595465 n=1 Tax=Erigeron canadensis TaxID=72917 RepID=UPI001CB95DE6|nr:uncharacterized protein LOC122595465 [Erigeron canadensis]
MAAVANDTTTPPISTTTTTTRATSSSSSSSYSSSSMDFELASIKPPVYNYTSLRDILPSAGIVVQSPRGVPCYAAHHLGGYEISIRNRLVKQAAWAYLQPMSTTPESDGPAFFHRIWNRFSGTILRVVAVFFNCIL